MLTGDMLRRAARRAPDKPAILWDDISMSYRELDLAANRFARAILALELPKGAKIGIICRNRPEYGVAFFGVARTGMVLVNVSVLYAPEELRYVLDKADVEALIFEDLFADKVAAVRARLPKIRRFVSVGSKTADSMFFDCFIADHSDTEPDIPLNEDDPFCMTYTGGTTGRPKGVLCSHRNRAITAHTVMVEERIDECDVVGIVTPMFHVAALNIMFQPAILAGATTTLLSKWEVRAFADMARRVGMTAAFMVPTQISMVVTDETFDREDYATWRKLSFAGAPMPDWVQREVMRLLPDVRMTQIYGQSEVGVLTALPYWHLPERLGSVGRRAYNVDVEVVDPDGKPVEPGHIGEIVSRGENVMLEYYGESEQTAGFFKHGDGWGWTGDLAMIDEDGFITLVDRSKDMIISGGENIYPKEIEDALYAHEAVSECAVFGVPDEHWGEVPAAYVQLKPGRKVTGQELEALCADKLARFKRPRLIKFVDGFPKTPIGKIQKNLLRDPYWQGRNKRI